MICAIMQPTYLPWLGYFELMARSDIFVFFDDVQFIKKSWHHRNKIKANDQELLLTIPVLSKGKRGQKINEVLINNKENWKSKHLKSIELNYKKAPYFNNYFEDLKAIYLKDHELLFDFTRELILFLKDSFKINTPVINSSDLNTEGKNEVKVTQICKKINCTTLYNTGGAKEVLDASILNKEGINVVFQEYKHPEYKQLGRKFLPYVSALDLLFNEGDKSLEIIKSGNTTF